MLRCRASLGGAALAAAVVLALSLPARAQVDGEHYAPGSACPSGAVAGHAVTPDWDTFFECNGSSQMQRGPYFFGATADTCDSNHAGLVQWTGGSVSPNNTFQFCNGSNWITVNGAASSVPLSGITAAATTSSIDSGANAITWAWGTLSTQTALTLTTSSMTTGTLLSLQNTAESATSTGNVLSISDATTGTGYGVYSSMTATANTGYAIYATNTGAGYALGATGTSTFNGYVGIGTATPGAFLDVENRGGGTGVYSEIDGMGGTGGSFYAPDGIGLSVESDVTGGEGIYVNSGGASSGGSEAIFAETFDANSTAIDGEVDTYGTGVYGADWGNTGYGVKGEADGGTASYGGYFINDSTGYALGATGTSYFNGRVGIGTTTPQAALDVNGAARVGSTAASCTISNAGAIQYTSGSFEGCNGANWGTIGGESPAAFSFTNQTGVGTGAPVTSNSVTLSGFTGAVAAACTGCTAMARNGSWGATSAIFLNGDTIAIRQTASNSISTTTTASVTVGQTMSGVWSVTTASTSYSGPGDVVAGASAWWGLRAYTHAYAITLGKAVNLRRASDNTTQDINVLGTGSLDVATASTFCASTTCFVHTAYDQSGNGCDFTATNAAQPTFVLSCLGSLPCVQFSGSQYLQCTNPLISQPYSFEAITERTSVGTFAAAMNCGNTQGFLGWSNTANTFQVQANNGGADSVTGAMSDNTWHVFQSAYNAGSAGAVYVDSTATSHTFGTNNCLNASGLSAGADAPQSNFFLTGKMTEGGVWAGAFNSTQAGNLSSNGHSYWGF